MAGIPWPLDDTWKGPRLPSPNPGDPSVKGIPYAMLFDDYCEKFRPNGNQVTATLTFNWADATDARQDLVGYTLWDGLSQYLQRYPPLACPYHPTLVCDDVESIAQGCMPDRESLDAGPGLGHWLECDWIKYRCTFRRPPYLIEPDDAGYETQDKYEFYRYTTVKWHFVTREQRIAALQLMTWPAANRIGAAAFISRYKMAFEVVWHQIPVSPVSDKGDPAKMVCAVPFDVIRYNLDKINLNTLYLPLTSTPVPTVVDATTPGVLVCLPGSLLFKGLANDFVPYVGGDGELYVDLAYVFEYEPTFPSDTKPGGGLLYPPSDYNWWGWNGFYDPGAAGRNPTWTQLRWSNQPAGKQIPPYRGAAHQYLFFPGGYPGGTPIQGDVIGPDPPP